MTYTLRLLTAASRDLVVEALRAEADKRTRVAQGAAQHVAAEKAERRDVRAASVRVTMLLAEAGELARLADELAAAQDVPLVSPDPVEALVAATEAATGLDRQAIAALTPLEEHADGIEVTGTVDDDGLSEAAHAAMAQAEAYAEEHLADPDEADVDTGADPEDEPTDDDLEEVLKP